ncbi:storkhead-box protein 1 isoform X1 [Agelaius phoeniceus]|uniref:storkhead-box protein 1 isoform X1 n=1 Tax=Agelaius phoeniceus TaxID=39638 RepID=UPI004054EC14
MNPLCQPGSVPLARGICWTISDMNADQVVVTQETLMEQLKKNFPGIAVPSHNVLYNILGTLIKERKIYHTGEGYFIVTPNTYFITNDATEDNRRILLEDSCCCSSPSIPDLVNIKACADLVKESIPTVPCYRSCHCFPGQNKLCEQRQGQGSMRIHGSNGEGQRGCSELRASIRTQGISTSAENHSWDTIKSLMSLKAKLKSKMLGLGLFWRSGSKKEKHKKEYSTFSGQFPPQEWPVRDEDDLDNIPRDIEHEIIKRINPTLTVDNLIKYTILMQKFEEQKRCNSKEKKYISNGTSAEVATVRQNHLSKDCIQRAPSKTAKHTRKTKSKREKQMSRSSRKSHRQKLTSQNVKLEESFSLPIKTQEPPAAAVESHGIYKKQIKNPFQGLPWRPRSFPARGHQAAGNSQLKGQTHKEGRAFQRPRPLAPSGPSGCETERLGAESEAGKAKQNNLLHANRPELQLKQASFSENAGYPQGSNLQIGNRSRHLLESNIPEENVYKRAVKKKSPCSYIEDNGVCKEDAGFPSYLKDEHCRCKADTVCELLDQTASDFQNVHLSHCTASVNLAPKNGVKYRPKTDKKSELLFNHDCASHPGSRELEREGFTVNSHPLYQKGHDGDTCTLSHLDDNSEQLPPGHALSGTGGWSPAVSLKASKVRTCPAHDTTINKCDMRYRGSAGPAESADGSKEHPKPHCTEESWLCSQALLKGHRKEEGAELTECGKGSAGAGSCQAGSDSGSLQNFTCEVGAGAARCALGSGTRGVRNPAGQTEQLVKSACPVGPEQKHPEGTENHSITGDSGIDSPRWTEKKMKLPAKY